MSTGLADSVVISTLHAPVTTSAVASDVEERYELPSYLIEIQLHEWLPGWRLSISNVSRGTSNTLLNG